MKNKRRLKNDVIDVPLVRKFPRRNSEKVRESEIGFSGGSESYSEVVKTLQDDVVFGVFVTLPFSEIPGKTTTILLIH